ncbi:succinate dehydrogenase, cytochrome b556 subunit [Chloroflexota bacterium]
MGLKRNVPLSTALGYKGQDPFLSFILHRIGGAGMAIFITIHILATFAEKQGWVIGDAINYIYMSPPFQIFILFCVLFHALNGLRITILDIFPRKLMPHYRTVIRVQWIVFILLFGFAAVSVVTTAIGRLS